MNPELLLKQFDRISDTPDAIARLRKFVLDLAVRGKLVEQSPKDEPASTLIKQVLAKKAEITKEGSVRKEKPLPPLAEKECPFSIPPTWSWTQLAEVGFINPRNTADGRIPTSFIPMPLISAEYGIANTHQVRPWGEIKSGFTHFAEGDVGLAKITPCFENGKSTIFRGLTGGIGAGTTELHVVRPVIVSADYVLIFLKCPHFIESGVIKMTGTAGQKRVPTEYFAYSPFPLPPLAEQRRIVAKVNELMALCDRLEAAQHQLATQRDRLAAASHYQLNHSGNAAALRRHTNFFIGHLRNLTSRPDQIKALRRTILNLAVSGHLVPQNASDEPASDLLRRIGAEKAQLAEEGSLKKDKALWEGLPTKPPYELPDNWMWTHLQDVFEISRGGSPRPAGDPRYFGGPIPWITVGEITKDGQKYLTETESGLTEEGAARSRFINPGDLLLTNSGATLGVPKVSRIKACMNDGVAVLRMFHTVPLNDFAYLYLHSQTGAFRKVNQGMGQPNLNTPIIAGWFFPVPPLAEQHRIVAKVEELMALCDQLESHLTTAQNETGRLLESVLHDALNETSKRAQTVSHPR